MVAAPASSGYRRAFTHAVAASLGFWTAVALQHFYDHVPVLVQIG